MPDIEALLPYFAMMRLIGGAPLPGWHPCCKGYCIHKRDILCPTVPYFTSYPMYKAMEDTILRAIGDHISVMERLRDFSERIAQVAYAVTDALKNGGKVVLFGNGGSSCDAQHIAAEMLGITAGEDGKKGLLAIALTDNTALLTAIGNDLGYEQVFSRQVEAIVQKRDLVIGISTSGNSPNVINGLSAAKGLGAKTVALTGKGGDLAKMADMAIQVPSDSVPRVQEAHITIGHIVCEVAQRAMTKEYLTRFSS